MYPCIPSELVPVKVVVTSTVVEQELPFPKNVETVNESIVIE
jgi:hypothetical protein